eukprot:2814884-Rhodomonas_salina.1
MRSIRPVQLCRAAYPRTKPVQSLAVPRWFLVEYETDDPSLPHAMKKTTHLYYMLRKRRYISTTCYAKDNPFLLRALDRRLTVEGIRSDRRRPQPCLQRVRGRKTTERETTAS